MMGPNMTTWQMVLDVEREIAVQRAARLGTLGAPPRRTPRLVRWLRRLTSTTPTVPAQPTRLPAREHA
ncbi:MAG: hypothetical protein ACRDJ9_18315 [Dehalococcoidia bacterium]